MNDKEHILDILLKKRGLESQKEIDDFINPKLESFHNPFDFEKMEEAVNKIIEIKNNKQKIIIYGDYDVDGITGTAFLTKVLREAGISSDYYIAARNEIGYGVDKYNIDNFKAKGYSLIITVDTGYNSIKDVDYARSLAMDIIVTDHHKSTYEAGDDNVIYINPKLSSKYKFKFLSGAGVALKLAQALYRKLNLDEGILYKYLDIVMIGTIADVVPMVDENRIIIKHGLKVFKNTNTKGLNYLLNYLKLNKTRITTTDVSYYVSPLINSLGRVGASYLGAEFLIKEDDFDLYNIIEEMKFLNKKRRTIEKKIYDDALKKIQKLDVEKNKLIFLSSNKWHSGVIGIVSSRLSIKYKVPVVLVALEDGFGKASCRSIEGVSIFNVLDKLKSLLVRYGGHDLAAGFVVEEKNLDLVKNLMLENIEYKAVDKTQVEVNSEYNLKIEDIDSDIIDIMTKLSPFGSANPHPLFYDRDVIITEIKTFGLNGRHFSAVVKKNNKRIKVLGFDLTYKLKMNDFKKKYDIIYYPEMTSLIDNREFYQLIIKDIK